MQIKLSWKKKVFSNLYRIYSNGKQIGQLKDKTFSQTAYGQLNSKEYTFKTKGFFKPNTEIIDNSERKVIGEITYNYWMTKAEISVNNKTYNWRYDNLWNTEWSVSGLEDTNIQYAGSSTSGQINSNIDDQLLLLSGLFVINYYWQTMVAIIIAVFVPLGTVVLT